MKHLFQKIIMQCDVAPCVISISNKIEHLNKEQSYQNFAKEVIMLFLVIFAMQSRNRAVARALIGVYIYIFVLCPTNFF